MKIISGGQTGIDRAALDFALSLGIKCGGWCPAGRQAEDGIIPEKYPLTEIPDGTADDRTARNVAEADGTVIFHCGLPLRGGTRFTAECALKMAKPHLLIDAKEIDPAAGATKLEQFVRENQIAVLNLAGPRASEWPEGYQFALDTLNKFFHTRSAAEPPTLSFIVPAHNEERELPETLRALRAAGENSGETFELIVVDDASTDATARIAEEFGARVIQIARRQIAASRNAGAAAARGRIYFFVDADTRISREHVIGGMDALKQGYSGGSARIAFDSDLPLWGRFLLRVFDLLYFGAELGVGAFIFVQAKTFEAVGGFDEQYFAGEEVYLTLALKKQGRFKILPTPVVTSARKLRMHSPLFVLGQSLFVLLRGERGLRHREKLALWYDGKREPHAI
jgi:GT2 family glycosyltransferase